MSSNTFKKTTGMLSEHHLEFSSGKSLTGSTHKGGGIHVKDFCHQTLADNLKDEYRKDPAMEVKNIKKSDIRFSRYPDILLEYDYKINREYALEVKISSGDFRSSLFQCRSYHLSGTIPYVVIPKRVFLKIKRELIDIWEQTPTNLPGLLVVRGGTVSHAARPKYEET